MINRYLEVFGVDEFALSEADKKSILEEKISLQTVLDNLIDIAYESGLIEDDGITQRDLFDTKLMGIMTARPAEVIRVFKEHYKDDPERATDWFYKFSQDTNYIRRDRIKKDRKWKIESKYGEIDVTINLSKPEKDPKAIAAARNAVQSSYPACQLCIENEGYAGRMNHPARQNHRIIPIEIQGCKWGFQYSPYVYYNEHCIVFNGEHTPMKIDESAFKKLFDFVKLFPHYFVGSNADLPIVGGSILSHDHFQGGHYTFAMEKAPMEKTFTVLGFEDVEMGIVKWPLSVLRLRCKNEELDLLGDYLVQNKDISKNEMIEKHADWVKSFRSEYQEITDENVKAILEKEVGKVFIHVLEDAGVYKCTEEGRAAFERFIATL